MSRMVKVLIITMVFISSAFAAWDSIRQRGRVTPGSLTEWTQDGEIADAGFSVEEITNAASIINVLGPDATNAIARVEAVEANSIPSNTWATITNQIAIAATNATAALSAVQSYAVDPATLQTQITANAASIDLINSPATYSRVIATTNAALNGLNLYNAVTALNGSGTENIFECDPTPDSGYTLPSTLTITGQAARIVVPMNWSCGTFADKYLINTYWHDPVEAPLVKPVATITGNLIFHPSALGSEIVGFKTVGTISATNNAATDITNSPPALRNGWHVGNIAENQKTSLYLEGMFVDGTYAAGTDSTNHQFMANAKDSIVLGDGSFYTVSSGIVKANLHYATIDNCWVAGQGAFGMFGNASKVFFRNSRVNGESAFRGRPGVGKVVAHHTVFYQKNANEYYVYPTWDGVGAGAPDQSEFRFCDGIATNIVGLANAKKVYIEYIDGSKSD